MVSEEQRLKHNIVCKRYYQNNKERHCAYMNAHRSEYTKRSICRMLKQHSADMSTDPEHLTTDFLKKILKVECK